MVINSPNNKVIRSNRATRNSKSITLSNKAIPSNRATRNSQDIIPSNKAILNNRATRSNKAIPSYQVTRNNKVTLKPLFIGNKPSQIVGKSLCRLGWSFSGNPAYRR